MDIQFDIHKSKDDWRLISVKTWISIHGYLLFTDIHRKIALHGYPCLNINVDIHTCMGNWRLTFKNPGYQCWYPSIFGYPCIDMLYIYGFSDHGVQSFISSNTFFLSPSWSITFWGMFVQIINAGNGSFSLWSVFDYFREIITFADQNRISPLILSLTLSLQSQNPFGKKRKKEKEKKPFLLCFYKALRLEITKPALKVFKLTCQYFTCSDVWEEYISILCTFETFLLGAGPGSGWYVARCCK